MDASRETLVHFLLFSHLGCGGNFSTPTGTLLSKNYPDNYPHNTECEWLITVQEGQTVVITFEDFDVEGGSCIYDYVAVSTFLYDWCASLETQDRNIWSSHLHSIYILYGTFINTSKRLITKSNMVV